MYNFTCINLFRLLQNAIYFINFFFTFLNIYYIYLEKNVIIFKKMYNYGVTLNIYRNTLFKNTINYVYLINEYTYILYLMVCK